MQKFLLIFLLSFYSLISFSQPGPRKGEILQLGDGNNYCAAIETSKFIYYVARQEYDNWCWAACIQMVLNYQGIKISQNDIVRKAFGAIVNRPAGCQVMTSAADNWNYGGVVIKAWHQTDTDQFELIDDLANKYPVIIGLNMPNQNIGHAYVLTAIYFQYNDSKKKIPYKVALRDPWPDNPSRTELTWKDFTSRINCIVHVTPQ